jgi:hypothetical protein
MGTEDELSELTNKNTVNGNKEKSLLIYRLNDKFVAK